MDDPVAVVENDFEDAVVASILEKRQLKESEEW